MTCGVTTYCYAAPEMLVSEAQGSDAWTENVPYGFGVDIGSFGCVFFELMTREMFSPECSLRACRVCVEERLGRSPESADLWEPTLSTRAAGQTCLAKVEAYVGVAKHPWITGTLQWLERQRLGAHNLLMAPTGDSVAVPTQTLSTQPVASAGEHRRHTLPSGIAGTTPHSDDGDDCESGASIISPHRSSPIPEEPNKRCKCAGHCYQPGHRTRGGCDAVCVVAGSQYSTECKCSARECMRPRLRGRYCFAHRKLAMRISPHMVLLQNLAGVLQGMIPSMTSLPSIIASSRSAGDLGCLVMTALISEHNIAKYFGGLRFTDNGLTDKDMANTIRKQFGAAMAGTNGLHTASQGWSGTVCSGIQLDGLHRHSPNWLVPCGARSGVSRSWW